MNTFGLDFYQLLAYFIPGFLFLKGAAFCFPGPKKLFDDFNLSEKKAIGPAFVISIMAVTIGMLITVLRTATIDGSFSKDLICWEPDEEWKWLKGIDRDEPKYHRLSSDNLDAFLKAEREHERRHQFFGNLLIATWSYVVFFVCSRKVALRRAWRWPSIRRALRLRIIFLGVASFLMYFASRKLFYLFDVEVEAFNRL